MAKYVEFNIPDKESSYFNVDDFNLETIEKLPLYNSKWFNIKCLEGKPRYYEGEILDIYPADIIRTIYYGKRISFEETKKIIGNDLKYKDLAYSMETLGRAAFFQSDCFKNLPNKDYYINEMNEFIQDYDKNHYCLFTYPDRFSTEAFTYENVITIEEFDPNVKLDYTNQLENIRMNAMAGKEYIASNKYILEMFGIYFESLISLSSYFQKENYNQLFNLTNFNFNCIKGMDSIEDINFFLQVFSYTKNKPNYSELLEEYKSYINQLYEEKMELEYF